MGYSSLRVRALPRATPHTVVRIAPNYLMGSPTSPKFAYSILPFRFHFTLYTIIYLFIFTFIVQIKKFQKNRRISRNKGYFLTKSFRLPIFYSEITSFAASNS